MIPLETERSVAVPRQKSLERLRRTVIESSKECGRNRLMQIHEPMKLPAWLEQAAGRDGLNLMADPSGHASIAEFSSKFPAATDIHVTVGPEGGFSDSELALAKESSWEIIHLGPRILRIETAAIFLAARC